MTFVSGSNLDGFFEWKAVGGAGDGACGVTDDPARAAQHLKAALKRLGTGASGQVGVVHLDRFARNPAYVYGRVLVRVGHEAVDVDQP
ncbi:hypothetical protein [Nonomuraea cavernae]|uniref:Uncharacterized protein n=1 Tax=Nonomuraea cavernae TaxID=2045107 RepID=A0A917Z0S2_9ACTN|nr:hypothetical protein [Nonomuraea cavernae]MCA2186455.1 hypothetical protein [Nonomuraea cavernae]GGO71134.1 hypothetical protein GCM10012289_36150 [Nonomuraea cavernae]